MELNGFLKSKLFCVFEKKTFLTKVRNVVKCSNNRISVSYTDKRTRSIASFNDDFGKAPLEI